MLTMAAAPDFYLRLKNFCSRQTKKATDLIVKHYLQPIDFGLDNASNRNQWIEEQLTSLPKGLRILDVGAGECQYKQYCTHLDYVAQDIAEYDGQGNAEGLQTTTWDTHDIDVVCDILDFPKKHGKFDAILCTEVLEHVPNPVAVLEKICSLLNKDGILILTAPFGSLTHFAPYHYATGFNKYFYQYHLEKCGLTIEALTPNGTYFEMLAQEMSRATTMHLNNINNPRIDFYKDILLKRNVRFLQKLQKEQISAGEDPSALGCHGYHIRAIKTSTPRKASNDKG